MNQRLNWIVCALSLSIACGAVVAKASDFGLSEEKDAYSVNTGADLVFKISRKNGDLVSMSYRGRECESPFEKAKRYSHYASGLSGGSVISADTDSGGQWIKITVEDPKINVTQYYMARKGDNAIYMATYAEKSPPPGEMRFMVFLNRDVFTRVPEPSDIARSNGGVEGKDVFKNSDTGRTYSKFYNGTPIIDGQVRGVFGDKIGCFFDFGNRETSSGGPFFKDIENQSGSSAEFYNYMFSGHARLEPFRPGLKGPYALQFTDGDKPVPPDYAFIAKLGLKGYVQAAERGELTGKVSGVRPGNRATISLSNRTAQYWATPDANGNFTVQNAIPGTYTMTLYDVELAVAKKSATVERGKVTTADIVATLVIPPAIFRIGEWDGTPRGFLNADKIADHHPSDSVMTPFKDIDFVVGQSKDEQWPLGEWRDVNNNLRITFNLTQRQLETPFTLRIGVTITYNQGRPLIELNAGTPHAWKGPVPERSEQPTESRGITRGTYRGINDTFAFNLPAANLQAGMNTIDIHIDGPGKAFNGFLSPNITFDAIDLITTVDAKHAAESAPPKATLTFAAEDAKSETDSDKK